MNFYETDVINPFIYTNDQFALVIQKTFAFFINALVICQGKNLLSQHILLCTTTTFICSQNIIDK